MPGIRHDWRVDIASVTQTESDETPIHSGYRGIAICVGVLGTWRTEVLPSPMAVLRDLANKMEYQAPAPTIDADALDAAAREDVVEEPEVDASEPTDAPAYDDEGITSDDAQMLLRLVQNELGRIGVKTVARAVHALAGGSVTALHAINQAAEQLRKIKTKLENLV